MTFWKCNVLLYKSNVLGYITNIKRKIKRGIYDHKKVIKMWMYLVDDAARKYVQEFGGPEQDVKDMFPKETRLKVAEIISLREKENIEQGEYDVVKGTITQRGR